MVQVPIHDSVHGPAAADDEPSRNGQQALSHLEQVALKFVRKLSGRLGYNNAANGDAAVKLSPELQQHLEQLQLACYTPYSIMAALDGEGPSKMKPKELGVGEH